SGQPRGPLRRSRNAARSGLRWRETGGYQRTGGSTCRILSGGGGFETTDLAHSRSEGERSKSPSNERRRARSVAREDQRNKRAAAARAFARTFPRSSVINSRSRTTTRPSTATCLTSHAFVA